MASQVILHVGAMKSGTSYLQALLFANQALLGSRGVLVPGATWDDQVRAVQDVLARGASAGDGSWDRLVEQVSRHEGTAVISMESLGPAPDEVIARVLGEWEHVTVVVTARDLNRSLVSMWQETVQNGRSWTFAEYLTGARDARARPGRRLADRTVAGRTFWRQQNIVRLCRNWSRSGARVVLLTVPPPAAPRTTLRDRFLDVVGTSAEGMVEPPRGNEAVGASSVQVLRRVNELLDEAGLPSPHGQHVRKTILAKSVLAGRSAAEPRIGLPVAHWVEEHAAVMVGRLRELDVELVGEWSDLTPVAVPGVDPAEVPDAEVAQAACAGLAGLLTHVIGPRG